mgnify:CR=1 FL=1|tara:strand:+ start:23125 stop:24597 length:1473 start_codon:yes stop_codon:yes gene_type:complete
MSLSNKSIFLLLGFYLASSVGLALDHSRPKTCTSLNDFSGLNETCVAAVVKPLTEEEFRQALLVAKEKGLKVSMAGQQHSLGGHSLVRNGLVIDIKKYNRIIGFDSRTHEITVQSGATWKDIQTFLDPKGFAVDVMQNFNFFTVAGSLSANAGGLNTQSSSISSNVVSIKIMLHDGQVVTASRHQNSELFSAVLGGYGLFGIILEATLKVTDNVLYKTKVWRMNYKQFPEFFEKNLAQNPNGMFQNYISIAPKSFMQEMVVMTYEAQSEVAEVPQLKENKVEKATAPVIGWLLNKGKSDSFWKNIAWFLEYRVSTWILPETTTRNQVMSAQMPPLAKHKNGEAFILQVYQMPKSEFVNFLDRLRTVAQKHHAPIVTASVLHLKNDETVFLSATAGEDRFTIVLGLVQEIDPEAEQKMTAFHREMIDEAIKLRGAAYLTHRMSYTPTQLRQMYPQIDQFFALKRKYDPNTVFSNHFYEKYGMSEEIKFQSL